MWAPEYCNSIGWNSCVGITRGDRLLPKCSICWNHYEIKSEKRSIFGLNWFLENSRSEYAFILMVLLWTKCVVSVSPPHYFAPLRQNQVILFLPSLFSVIKWKSESFIKSEWHLKLRANRKISHGGSDFSSFLLYSHLLIKYCTFQWGLMGVSSSQQPSSFLWLHYLITALVLALICTLQLNLACARHICSRL